MKIVIDIPEGFYEEVRKDPSVLAPPFLSCEKVGEIIANGTPLPKRHGDLVDFDRLCEEYWDGNYMEIHKDDLSNIKPIIEADKEE